MDFLWNLIDSIQKSAMYLVIKDLAPIDWVAIFFVLFGMLQGSRKGFIDMLAKSLNVTIVIILTLTFYPLISAYLVKTIQALPKAVANPLVFIPTGVVAWLVTGWCFNVIGRIFKVEVSSFLKFFGGVFFGGIYSVLLLSLFVQMVLLIPGEMTQKPFTQRGSYSGQALAKLAPGVQRFVAAPFVGTRESRSRPAV